MLPAIMAILSLAQSKAQNEENSINQLNQNRLNYSTKGYGGQQMSSLPQQSNNIGSTLGTISSIYGSFGK